MPTYISLMNSHISKHLKIISVHNALLVIDYKRTITDIAYNCFLN